MCTLIISKFQLVAVCTVLSQSNLFNKTIVVITNAVTFQITAVVMKYQVEFKNAFLKKTRNLKQAPQRLTEQCFAASFTSSFSDSFIDDVQNYVLLKQLEM